MSWPIPSDGDAVVVRADQAEIVGRPPTTVRLLADSSATGGALSTIVLSSPAWRAARSPNSRRS